MPELPSGTVTVLFSDIEGSTKLWEHGPTEMGAALVRHNALLREAFERSAGYVFKTMGDGFCAAFPTASNALTTAITAQLAIASEPWPEFAHIRVRMALHTGAAEMHDNDYFGPPLNRVARLLSAGHGGQILLSLATQERVRDSLLLGITLRDMGERRLKDLIRPERVYQVVAPGLPAEFPPLKTLDARARNLPIQSTSFVGRDREMEEVKTRLRSSRLVTLTGSGGTGKTRLALQVGADRIDDFADGVWFVELAPLTDARLAPQAVATVLGIKEQPGAAITDTLTRELKTKELLLLLDNCEHLIEASAQLCQVLLAACANICILITSREALRIPGEATYRVPSLATPDSKSSSGVEALTQYAAVQLFVDRALAVKTEFRVDNGNAPAVASICHHLDGIPLALELAAARVRSMSVEEVNERLHQRFHLLIGGSRTALPRQQTLRSAIDWSYDLLHEAEQALFRQISVFADGWTIDAAEQVCGTESVEMTTLLDVLTSLTDKSLVLAEERNGATRFRLLETVRQYSRDRLWERREQAHWQDRHLAYFLALADSAEPHLTGAEQQSWLDRLEIEHENFRAALAFSCAGERANARGMELADALWRFWSVRGYLSEGRRWLSQLLAAAPVGQAAAMRWRALDGAGNLARMQGDYPTASTLHQESLAIARQEGQPRGIAASLISLGLVARALADYPTARAYYEEGLAIQRDLGDQRGIAMALSNLGNVAHDQGDYKTDRALQVESLAIRRGLGDRGAIAMSLNNLGGTLACTEGDLSVARTLLEESLAIGRELGDWQGIASSLNNLAIVAASQGDSATASTLQEECMAIQRAVGDRRGIASSLGNLGNAPQRRGDYRAARARYKDSLAIQRDLGDRRRIVASLEGLVDPESILAEPSRAARILGVVDQLRVDIDCPVPPGEQPGYDKNIAAVRAAIGEDARFDRAWQEGRAMTLDQAIEYALQEHVADG